MLCEQKPCAWAPVSVQAAKSPRQSTGVQLHVPVTSDPAQHNGQRRTLCSARFLDRQTQRMHERALHGTEVSVRSARVATLSTAAFNADAPRLLCSSCSPAQGARSLVCSAARAHTCTGGVCPGTAPSRACAGACMSGTAAICTGAQRLARACWRTWAHRRPYLQPASGPQLSMIVAGLAWLCSSWILVQASRRFAM